MTDSTEAALTKVTTAERLADLKDRYHEAVTASGAAAIEKQHAKGKKTARERIEQLLDHGTFVELDEFVRHRTTAFGMDAKRPYGDAVVTGMGTIHNRPVAVYSQDFTIFGGSLGEVAGEKIIKVMDARAEDGRADHRHPRLGRRPDPGGRRRARQVRRDLPPEHRAPPASSPRSRS